MFVVPANPEESSFSSPVVAKIPADGGRCTTAKFSVFFKRLEKEAVEDLLKEIRERAQAVRDDAQATPLTDREVLNRLLVGFGPDLLEEDKTRMEFTPANMDRLCKIYPLEAAMVKSFFDNYVNAPTKN